MRWFKHISASRQDQRLAALMDKHGLAGYGFWWCVLEIVAQGVGSHGQTTAAFSRKRWANLLGISTRKFQVLAQFCANLGLFSLEASDDLLVIGIPSILKYRDEYSQRKDRISGECRDKLSPEQIQKQIQKTKTQESEPPAPKKAFGLSGNVWLSAPEYARLCQDFSAERAAAAIQLLDDTLGAKEEDPYKSHYHALRKWVFHALNQRAGARPAGAPAPESQNNYPHGAVAL